MNPTSAFSPLSSRTDAGQPHSHLRLGLALFAAALLSATACGNDARTEAGSSPTTAPTTTTTATTTPTTVASPTTTVTTVARPTATIDQLVGAQGARVHIRCIGNGDTTVLLIAGFTGSTESWVKVEPALDTRARVCSYDRPGTGTSDPATSIPTFATQATDLHALLGTIGEPGPYVVVGHSFGGAEAIEFASRFADEVSGLVLIDASPATWPAALCAVRDDGSEATATVHSTCTGAFLPTGNSEHLDVAAAFAEVSKVVSLGSIPMAVVTATVRELPAGLAAAEVARLTETWNQGQRDWMRLSTAAHLVAVDRTSHHIELDQPEIVIEEITRLLP